VESHAKITGGSGKVKPYKLIINNGVLLIFLSNTDYSRNDLSKPYRTSFVFADSILTPQRRKPPKSIALDLSRDARVLQKARARKAEALGM
jgi:hypothetical protein